MTRNIPPCYSTRFLLHHRLRQLSLPHPLLPANFAAHPPTAKTLVNRSHNDFDPSGTHCQEPQDLHKLTEHPPSFPFPQKGDILERGSSYARRLLARHPPALINRTLFAGLPALEDPLPSASICRRSLRYCIPEPRRPIDFNGLFVSD